jgi:hypothetical protein
VAKSPGRAYRLAVDHNTRRLTRDSPAERQHHTVARRSAGAFPPEGHSGSESLRRSRPMTAPPCIANCAQPGRGQGRQPCDPWQSGSLDSPESSRSRPGHWGLGEAPAASREELPVCSPRSRAFGIAARGRRTCAPTSTGREERNRSEPHEIPLATRWHRDVDQTHVRQHRGDTRASLPAPQSHVGQSLRCQGLADSGGEDRQQGS